MNSINVPHLFKFTEESSFKELPGVECLKKEKSHAIPIKTSCIKVPPPIMFTKIKYLKAELAGGVEASILSHGPYLSSEENVHKKNKGWADCWDDENCRSLVKSHMRTFRALEETSTRRSNTKHSRKSILRARTTCNESLLVQISEMKNIITKEKKEADRLRELHTEMDKSIIKLRSEVRKYKLRKRAHEINNVYSKMEEMKIAHTDLQESIDIYTLDKKQMEIMNSELKYKIKTLRLDLKSEEKGSETPFLTHKTLLGSSPISKRHNRKRNHPRSRKRQLTACCA